MAKPPPPLRPPPRVIAPVKDLPKERTMTKLERERRFTYEIRENARLYTEEALKVILEIMNDPDQDGKTRLVAADKILDRAWGKPTVKLADDDLKPLQIKVDLELQQLFQRLGGPTPPVIDVTPPPPPELEPAETPSKEEPSLAWLEKAGDDEPT